MRAFLTGLFYPIDLTNLPISWTFDYLGEFADLVQSGFACGRHNSNKDGVAHIRPMNISRDGRIDLGDMRFVPVDFDIRRLSTGDVLFNNTNSPELIGKTAFVGKNGAGLAFSNHMTRILFTESVDSQFAALQLHYLWMMKYFLHRCVKHVNQASISSTDLAHSIPLVVPPIREQRRIVAKIEELFSELDRGVEALTTAQEQLKAYRQSVLKYAFEGKLTEDWRAGRHDLETGSELRLRILRLRKHEWEEAEKTRLELEGRLPRDNNWKARYPNPEPFDNVDLPEIPAQWCWAGLDELVSGKPRSMQSGPFGSNLRHSEFRPAGVLVLGIDNVHDGTFSMGSGHRIPENKFQELEKYQARPGDLLVTVMASLGRTCVVPRDLEKAIITKHVYRISMNETVLYPEFFNFLLQSHTASRRRMFQSAQGQTRAGLNSSILKVLPVPLCCKLEQIEIVSRLSSRLSVIEKAAAEIDEQLARANTLRQSILKQAFSGQLVAQDPADEPASVLLGRIRAERAKSGTNKASTKKPERKTRKTKQAKEPVA